MAAPTARHNVLMPPRRRRNTKRQADAPLIRRPSVPTAIDPSALAERLRRIHEHAEDPNMERMPPTEELWGVLLYCERNASALRDRKLAREAALLCITLWEHVRHQQELHEGRAVRRAEEAGATWGEQAGPLRVSGPSGAYAKGRRLKAVELSTRPEIGPVRRTPEAVARIERELAAAERSRRLRGFAAEDQEKEWIAHAKALLTVRKSLPKDNAGIIAFWAEQTEYDLQEEAPARAISHDVQSLLRAVEIATKKVEGSLDEETGKVLADARAFVTKSHELP